MTSRATKVHDMKTTTKKPEPIMTNPPSLEGESDAPPFEACGLLNPEGSETRINLTPDGDTFYLPNVLAEAHGWAGPSPDETMANVAKVCEGLWNPRDRLRMKIYGKWKTLPRDKVFMGAYEAIEGSDNEAMVPIYRYSGNTGKAVKAKDSKDDGGSESDDSESESERESERESDDGNGSGSYDGDDASEGKKEVDGEAYIPVVHSWEGTIVADIARHLSALTGFNFNQVVANRFVGGSDHISYHHDKRRDMAEGTPIATLTLCEEDGQRQMHLRRVRPRKGKALTYTLEMGSLYMIGDKTNQTHKHEIPKRPGVTGVRYSLTFRCIETAQRVTVVRLASGIASYERMTVLTPEEGHFRGFASEKRIVCDMDTCNAVGAQAETRRKEARVAQLQFVEAWGRLVDDLGVKVPERTIQRLGDHVKRALGERGFDKDAITRFMTDVKVRLRKNVDVSCLGAYRYSVVLRRLIPLGEEGTRLREWLETSGATAAHVASIVHHKKTHTERVRELKRLEAEDRAKEADVRRKEEKEEEDFLWDSESSDDEITVDEPEAKQPEAKASPKASAEGAKNSPKGKKQDDAGNKRQPKKRTVATKSTSDAPKPMKRAKSEEVEELRQCVWPIPFMQTIVKHSTADAFLGAFPTADKDRVESQWEHVMNQVRHHLATWKEVYDWVNEIQEAWKLPLDWQLPS